jgi:hypothetical protein
MTASSPTKVRAHITMSPGRTNEWEVKCDSCGKLSHGPIRIFYIGRTSFELCTECVGELKTVIAGR